VIKGCVGRWHCIKLSVERLAGSFAMALGLDGWIGLGLGILRTESDQAVLLLSFVSRYCTTSPWLTLPAHLWMRRTLDYAFITYQVNHSFSDGSWCLCSAFVNFRGKARVVIEWIVSIKSRLASD